MEVVTIIGTVVSTVLTQGNALINVIDCLRNARPDIEDRTARIKAHWVRTTVQLDFVQRTWEGLLEQHRLVQVDNLTRLRAKVKSAGDRVQSLLWKQNEQQRVKRFKYLLVKPYLDTVIKDLADWQALYDPSWFLIMKIASPLIDAELKRSSTMSSAESASLMRSASKIRQALSPVGHTDTHIFLSSDVLIGIQVSRIPYSGATQVQVPGKGFFIVDSIPCPRDSYVGPMSNDVRRLAIKLQAADPETFGVLNCRGVVRMKASKIGRVTSFDMVFPMPAGHQPCSLRRCLLTQPIPSLTERVKIGKRLATSVNYVHTLAFVHKNVRPENFISMVPNDQPGLGSFYLIGFEHVRSEEGVTYMRGSNDWAQNIYRHPDRQGAAPEERYNMRHDIYSLGVCLLEIGLWKSFVSCGEDGTVQGPGEVIGLSLRDIRKRSAGLIKDDFQKLARNKLPPLIGDTYAEVVVRCLTCLDADSDSAEDFEDTDDSDGVLLGVQYIENILSKLNAITV